MDGTEVRTTVQELDGTSRIDRENGGLVIYRNFLVQRPGHEAHRVRVAVSESGTPQNEHCDCRGYEFRGRCCHITAVYEAGLLFADYGA